MSDTYTTLLVHCIFSTRKRRPLIPEAVQPRLWAYMGGIARKNGMKALAIGGMRDHVHVLLSLSTVISVAKAIQVIKAGSSKWMNERSFRKGFAWQTGYGAFTIGISQVAATVKYIKNQPEHHRKRGYADEIRLILKRHGIPVVER